VFSGQIQEQGAVLRDVRLGVDAAVILLEEPLFLQAVAIHPVVGVGNAQIKIGAGILPAELAEPGADPTVNWCAIHSRESGWR
jgi:hypothetical protein